MSQVLKERLKNYIILILIVAGILQVGILFGYQNQGTPTNFIMGLFGGSGRISDKAVRDKLFVPDRIILSNGDNSYRVLKTDSKQYMILWDEAKRDLRSAVSGETQFRPYGTSVGDWGVLTDKKGIILEFGYTIRPELLCWFLGIKEAPKDFPDVRKIMIKPDIIDSNTGFVYILNNDGGIYATDPITFDRSVDLDKIYEEISEIDGYRVFNTFRSAKIDKALKSPPDVLYVNSSPKYWPYYKYSCDIPDKAKNSEQFAEILLGNEKGRYDKRNNINDSFQFDNTENVYRLFPDGLLTYRYLGAGSSAEKGGIAEALLNAYKFIDRVGRLLNSQADIMLTGVEEVRDGVYKVNFDYWLDGMPVRLDKSIQSDVSLQASNGEKLSHAISIRANGKRILECNWLLRDFNQAGRNNYNDRFIDLLPLTGLGFDELEINDVRACYVIKDMKDSILKPAMLIDTRNKSAINIEMPAEKGD